MKKLRKIAWILLVISTVAMAAFLVYEKVTRDVVPPEISVPGEVLEAGVQVTEEELLAGVTAWDQQSGDVTDALVVEKLGTVDENDQRVITYAAIDDSGNVGRARRILQYTDYEPPHFTMSGSMRRDVNQWSQEAISGIRANSPLDGDLTGMIKFQYVNGVPKPISGTVAVMEVRVTDSAGSSAVLPLDIVYYDGREELLKPELTDYLVYLKEGQPFDPYGYYRRASNPADWELQVDSQVNTAVPGVYTVDYRAESDRGWGMTRLIVVVESE